MFVAATSHKNLVGFTLQIVSEEILWIVCVDLLCHLAVDVLHIYLVVSKVRVCHKFIGFRSMFYLVNQPGGFYTSIYLQWDSADRERAKKKKKKKKNLVEKTTTSHFHIILWLNSSQLAKMK